MRCGLVAAVELAAVDRSLVDEDLAKALVREDQLHSVVTLAHVEPLAQDSARTTVETSITSA